MDIIPRQPEQTTRDYSVRRLRPEDAAGVVACVRRVYGDSYVHREVYDPDQIIRLNESGELVSVVALHSGEQVVGHYALERPGLRAIAEEGEALVLPEHRHHHLMEALRGLLEEAAHELGLTGLYGQAVTNHVFTQKVWQRFDLRVCGLSLGASPRSFHNMSQPLSQRMSLLLGFKYLRPPSRVAIHAPEQHRAMCAQIYGQFGLAVEFHEPRAAEGPGQILEQCFPLLQEALIQVKRVGTDSAAAVRRARRTLCDGAGTEAIFLELPLDQAGTPDLCRAVEQEGFFFSGIGPCFNAGGDVLRLQFLKVELDIALLELDCPFARKLAGYVAEERARCQRTHGQGVESRRENQCGL